MCSATSASVWRLRVWLRPLGSPTRPVKLPMISTTVWPKRWNWASFRSTTAWPRVRCGDEGSMPSLTRRGRPWTRAASSRSSRAPAGRTASAPAVRTRSSCFASADVGIYGTSLVWSPGPGAMVVTRSPAPGAGSRAMLARRHRSSGWAPAAAGTGTGAAGGDVGAGGDEGAPGAVGGAGDADAAGPGDLGVGHGPPFGEPHGTGAKVGAVGPGAQAQRLGQAAGPAREVPRAAGGPARGHRIDPEDGLPSAQQDSLGHARRRADDVDAVVHPVGEVDVEMPGWTEHHRVAWRPAAVGVAGGILAGAVVGLDLHQPDRRTPLWRVVDQQAAEQVARHLEHRPQVEALRQRPQRPRGQLPARAGRLPGPRRRRGQTRLFGSGGGHRRPRPLARKRSRPAAGRVLTTCSGPIQPRPAVATEKRMLARWPGPWLSEPKASRAACRVATRSCSSPRSSRAGEPFTSRAVPVRAAAAQSASTSTS